MPQATPSRLARGALALFLVLCAAAGAENWPNWRGPTHTGATSQTGLPATWSETENVAWDTPMPGPSSATPIVWGDRVFVSSTDRQTGGLLALCLDAASGRVLWKRPMGKDRRWPNNNMATPSPLTDGKTVCFYYGTGTLAALDFEGKELWRRELQKDYGAFVAKWGYSSSPLLYKGKLYVPVFQNDEPRRYRRDYAHPLPTRRPLESFLLALDPATGKTLWKHVRPTDAKDESTEAYITPIPFEGAGRPEVVVVGGECVTGHDPETGKELWRWWFTPPDRRVWQRVVTSLVPGDGLIYATRPKHRPLFALKTGGNGTLTNDAVAWSFDGPAPDASTPLLYRGRLYVQDGDQKKAITCLDAKTGKQLWQGRLGGRHVYRASPTGADGKIYCINKAGDAVVLAAGDQFKVLARIRMGGSPCRSTIVAAAGRLFIRTARRLVCIQAGAKKP